MSATGHSSKEVTNEQFKHGLHTLRRLASLLGELEGPGELVLSVELLLSTLTSTSLSAVWVTMGDLAVSLGRQ
jgi:hypothetical protein